MKNIVIRIKNEKQWKVVQHVALACGCKWEGEVGPNLSDEYGELEEGRRTIRINSDSRITYNAIELNAVSFSTGLLRLFEQGAKPTGIITAEEKRECVDHYNRMIEWATKQKSTNDPSSKKMEAAIGGQWFDTDCFLCKKYRSGLCSNCPLKIAGERCEKEGSLWAYVKVASTWAEWVTAACKLRDFIAAIPEK